MRRKIAAGNWKMNFGPTQAKQLVSELVSGFDSEASQANEVILAVPFVDIAVTASLLEGKAKFALAAQNMHQAEKGAYTGEISAEMLVDAGCQYVLVGHSERREYFGETNDLLLNKAQHALANGLAPVYCFGETLSQREAGSTYEVLEKQLEEGIFKLP
ncbi:MAG: triose-phosphate isomerase family protein, partial [Aureispira sp.]